MSGYFTQHVLHHQDFGAECVAWCGERTDMEGVKEWFNSTGSAALSIDQNRLTQPCTECWAAIQEQKQLEK